MDSTRRYCLIVILLFCALTGYAQNSKFNSITNVTTLLSGGAVGLGSTLTVAGVSTLAATTHTSSSNSTTMLVAGAAGLGSTLAVAGAQTNVSTLLVNGAVGLGSTLAVVGAITPSSTINFADGVRQTFNPNGTSAGLNVGSQAGDPGTPSNGDIWYDSTANTLDARINGATVNLGSGGAGSPQTPIAQDVNWVGFKATNLGGIHMNAGAITATATNLTGTTPDLLMNRHSVITYTPTAASVINVVTPTGLDHIWPYKRLIVVVTGATEGLVHSLIISNVVAENQLILFPGSTNRFDIEYDGITNRIWSLQYLTNGSGPLALSTNATLTTLTTVGLQNTSSSNSTTALVAGNAGYGGSVTVAGAFTNLTTHGAGGAASFGSTMTVAGAATNLSTHGAGGAASFGSTVRAAGAVSLLAALNVAGTASMDTGLVTNNITYLTANLVPTSSGTNFQADFTFGAQTYDMTNAFWLASIAQAPAANQWKGWSAILRNNSGAALQAGMAALFKRSGTNNVSVPNGARAKVLLEPDGTGGTQLTNFLGQIILFESP